MAVLIVYLWCVWVWVTPMCTQVRAIHCLWGPEDNVGELSSSAMSFRDGTQTNRLSKRPYLLHHLVESGPDIFSHRMTSG